MQEDGPAQLGRGVRLGLGKGWGRQVRAREPVVVGSSGSSGTAAVLDGVEPAARVARTWLGVEQKGF